MLRFMEMDQTLDRINALLAYAGSRSGFYGYLPGEPLESMEQFRQIPTICEEDLVANGSRMLCCHPSRLRRMVTMETSGTTGQKKRLAFTEADLERTVSFFHHGMARLCGPGDRVGIFMPGAQPDGLCDLLSRGLLRFGAIPHRYGLISDLRDAARFCETLRPQILVGIPSQIRALALTIPSLRPHSVLLSADYAAPALVETLRQVWQCRVFLHYGSTESGLGCAVQVPGKDSMELRPDCFLETLPDGEIVLTTFDREAMPLIRYRTGDRGVVLPNGELGAVYGRIRELEKPVSIYALDQLLFGVNSLTDYRASLRGDILRIDYIGELDGAESLLAKHFPQFRLELHPTASLPRGQSPKRGVYIAESGGFSCKIQETT